MAKFTFEDKLWAVKEYEKGGLSFRDIAKMLGTVHKTIQTWVNLYLEHGEDSLRKSYTNYSAEFKMEVLKYMDDNWASSNEAAAKFNIPDPSIINTWRRAVEIEGVEALLPKKKGRPPMTKERKKNDLTNHTNESLIQEIERLRMENAYPKKVECLSSGTGKITSKLKAQVIFELRNEYKVAELIKIADIKRSTYYYWTKHMNRPDKYAKVKEAILEIYHQHKGRYGHRNIKKELDKKGLILDPKTVLKLMNQMGIKCQVRMKKYKSYRGNVGRIAPNVLNRDFQANKPNQKWVTDVTEFSLFGQNLYLSPILDLFNSEVISYTVKSRPSFDLVGNMLEQALQVLNPEDKLILHSDQGWHYQMDKYQKTLKDRNITQSMSRKGNCLDNAVIENFFGILKTELLYLQEFKSIEHFIQELHDYIYYYNNIRMKKKLKNLSPVEYRSQVQQVA
ncbi:IS3 family transposase [Neobacillus cucumis]|uniref:IS3 family transposase n=2 Tax=Bacillaceae TaxID=186817 RepID=A0A2N5H9V6_9BACI|nr:IS3 family transposase [Neobacillus cucumis]PLS02284.1 IS3 family transposase [Neobacillus cucumis]